MNICVVGTGYVGLVTGAVFADLGNEVICVDNQHGKIAELRAGRMPIYEPGLEEMVARNVADGRLSFSTDLAEGVRRSVIVFITVGTPPKSDGQTDLTAVRSVWPSLLGGVPTVMNTMTERRTPSARSVENDRRPSATLRATISSSPGS